MSDNLEDRFRLKTSVEAVHWLAKQGVGFGGNDDDSFLPLNRFADTVEFFSSVKQGDLGRANLCNAAQNDEYLSPSVQKEILDILTNKVRDEIIEEVGDAKFCIFIDEAMEDFDKYQIAIILRFVDREGFVKERILEIVDTQGISAVDLKEVVSSALARCNLRVEDMRGQGYDGASNWRGAWDELQKLFLMDCPYAYYVHCFAHPLESALITASKGIYDVYVFFRNLDTIVNLVAASPKRHEEDETEEMAAYRGLGFGRGSTGTWLQQSKATPSIPYVTSTRSIIHMFNATATALEDLVDNGCDISIRAPASEALKAFWRFEFVFVLLLMNEVMETTNILCEAARRESTAIKAVLSFVSAGKRCLQQLKQNGWSRFWERVVSFCERHEIDVPDMDAQYKGRISRISKKDRITTDHHYHVDVFDAVIDLYLTELESRFSDQTVKLLTLSSALDPCNGFQSFKTDDICQLAQEFYPQDFAEDELQDLKNQLVFFHTGMRRDPKLQSMSSLSELCIYLFRTRQNQIYFLIDRLVRLLLTLPISTAATERVVSAMQTIKTRHWDNMEKSFLANCMVVYIERCFANEVDPDSIVDEFYSHRGIREDKPDSSREDMVEDNSDSSSD